MTRTVITMRLSDGEDTVLDVSPDDLAKFAFGGRVTTKCTLSDLNSNLAIPWRLHGKPCGSPVTSDLSLNLSERSVRVPFGHFVCTTLCSASVGTNSGDLLPTRPLPEQQVIPVGWG
ncbi:hypothetical protein E2C01_015841 [Portunus trituberculatus]|uniref:Uncharacterized protein n=1 Tax=Portunus trituberculatus TaxID=210409 RepID=A0A5B7DP53_PORTR|nr:hypothetical protein [Portunus trituberculatus]